MWMLSVSAVGSEFSLSLEWEKYKQSFSVSGLFYMSSLLQFYKILLIPKKTARLGTSSLFVLQTHAEY